MQNQFLKQLGKTAKDQAKAAAKQIVHEPGELLKNTVSQVKPPETKQTAPEISVITEIMTGGGKVKDVTPVEEASIHSQAKSRLAQIEAEIRRLRMEREQKSQEYLRAQDELMKTNQTEEKPKEVPIPSSGHKKGPANPRQAKKGSREVGKQYGA